MPSSLDLDLTPIAPRRRERRRRIRLISGVAVVLVVVAWIAVLEDEYATTVAPAVYAESSPAAYENWVLFVGLGLLAGVAVWAFIVLGAEGATGVSVDDQGIHFSWRSGRRTSLSWDSPRFRLDLWVVPKATPRSDDLEVAARAKVRFHGATDLTEEALRAILAGADSHGLTILKRRGHGIFPSDPISTLLIRPRTR